MPTSYRYMSWNVKQFGEKAEKDVLGDTDVKVIANIILGSGADAVGIMEVTTQTGALGMQQVWQVLDTSLPGAKWQFIVTSNDGYKKADRNGFFWKESRLFFRGFYWTDTSANNGKVIFYNRYPAVFRFNVPGTTTYMNFLFIHAPSPSEDGGRAALSAINDVSKLDLVVKQQEPVIVSGDFNIDYNKFPGPYTVISNLGYTIQFAGQQTSLSTKVDPTNGNYLASAYDNIYVCQKSSPMPAVANRGVYDFVHLMAIAQNLPAYTASDPAQQNLWQQVLKVMRSRVSDHLPVWVDFSI